MEGYCRGCLREFNEPTELLQYSESNRRLFVYCTGIQVKRNDTFTFQLCKECFLNLKFACKFKKQCRSSDKKYKNYLSLRNEGGNMDISAFLKNLDDGFSLLPLINKSSSPSYKKNYDDDDNDSTCTSIQNFMTDIHETLQDEDILPTEASIIREVIQEEADISDDSLDSRWLQDDEVSYDNEFGMDFNFTGFSTPHSTNDEQCNPLERISNDEDDMCHYIHKDVMLKSDKTITTCNNQDMPSLDSAINNAISRANTEFAVDNITELVKQPIKTTNEGDMSLLDGCDITFDSIIGRNVPIGELQNNYPIENFGKINSEPVSIILTKGLTNEVVIKSPFSTELEFYMNNVELNRTANNNSYKNDKIKLEMNENSIDSIPNHELVYKTQKFPQEIVQYVNTKVNVVKNIETVESQVKNELNTYINKAELKKNITKDCNTDVVECSIDKNLELALKNDSEEFPLDQLLLSPQVSDIELQSGASTPTINNILFGNITPKNIEQDSPKPKNPLDYTLSKDDSFTKEGFKQKPKQCTQVKDLVKLKKSKEQQRRERLFKGSIKSRKSYVKSEHKSQTKGYKDLKRLRDLKVLGKNYETVKSSYESIQTRSKSEINTISNETNIESVHMKNEMCVMLENTEPEDLNISISKLLNLDDTNSVDLNISIASDFLIEGNSNASYNSNDYGIHNKFAIDENGDIGGKDQKDLKNLFKKPLPPPDDKYDLEKGLCKICNKSFKNIRALKQHFLRIHKLLLPKLVKKMTPKMCPICGKLWKDVSNYNRHMRSHEAPENIKCKYCTLEFPTRGRYGMHLRAHTQEINEERQKSNSDKIQEKITESPVKSSSKSFVCTTCGKTFSSFSNLNIHVKRHTTNYTKKCEICSKGFFRSFDLQQHMATHNNIYAFKCQHCPKKYRNRYMLVGHMYRHLGIKKFMCEACDRQFDTNQMLQKHYATEACVLNRRAKAKKEANLAVAAVTKKEIEEIKKPIENSDFSEVNITIAPMDMHETDMQSSTYSTLGIEPKVETNEPSFSPKV